MEKWGGHGYNHRMKKRRLTIPTYFFLILFVLCIVGLVLGSFFDLKISQAIGDPTGTNVFGAIIETIAIVPAYMLMGFAGCLLGFGILSIVKMEKYKKWKVFLTIVAILGIIATIAAGTYFLGGQLEANRPYDNYGYRINNKIVAYILAFLLQAISAPIVYFFLDRENGAKMLKVGAIIAFALVFQVAVLTVLKRMAGRPRFRFLFGEDGGNYNGVHYIYQEWFEFHGSNPRAEAFKSWPSGHSGVSGALIGLGYLPLVLKKRFKNDCRILFIIGAVYAFIIFFGRIVAGAHFLSDVATGGLIAFLGIFLASFFIEKVFPFEKEVKTEAVEAKVKS